MYIFASSKLTEKMNFRKEHIIYTLMWIVLYIAPVMGLYMRMSSNPDIDFSWTEILNAWSFNTIWLVLFAIHNYLLAPLLIVKRRTWLYSILCLGLLTATTSALIYTRPVHDDKPPRHSQRPPIEHVGHDFRRHNIKMPKKQPPEMHPLDPMPMIGPGELVSALGGLLLMGMNLGVKLYFKSQEDNKVLGQIEKHNLEQQLEYLKYQVNPHFFMNTLNNIHALVDIDPERAKTTIVELSKMMRYILYEGNNKLIPLQRELHFIETYVALMRMRYTDSVSINLALQDNASDMMLPPLLLIIFVENAFKHGVSYRTKSFINISVSVRDHRLYFHCRNSRSAQTPKKEKGGVGLRNVRRRLELLFPKNYNMCIKEDNNTYDVMLDIPLTRQENIVSNETRQNSNIK